MKKIGLLCLSLVLALGLMGGGLAYWTDVLYISGTVATGELDLAFTNAETDDNEDEVSLGFDVGWNEVSLSDTDDDGDLDQAVITVHNAYHSFKCITWFTVENVGTIPVHITVTVTSSDPELDISISDDPTSTIIQPGESVIFDVTCHVLSTAHMSSQYSYVVDVLGDQFNAGPWP